MIKIKITYHKILHIHKINIVRVRERKKVLGDMDVANFTAMGFVGLDVNPTVGIPEAYGTVLAAAQGIIAVGIEPGC